MASTLLRSFVKGCSWELISFIITFLFVFIIYGNFYSALNFSIILTVFKIFLFLIHERIWKTIKWGKPAEKSFYVKSNKNAKVKREI